MISVRIQDKRVGNAASFTRVADSLNYEANHRVSLYIMLPIEAGGSLMTPENAPAYRAVLICTDG